MVAEYSYDAWGRLRDPATQELYGNSGVPDLLLWRGFTGHEWLPWFGLYNMNARLYDPVLGRFLSPDPYVQMPDNTQNLNRYLYALNNPFQCKDDSGEFFLFTIFTAIGETLKNLFKHGLNTSQYSYQRTRNAAKIDLSVFQGNALQILGKLTWGIKNTLFGKIVAHATNVLGIVDEVTVMDGAVALGGVTGGGAFTLGNYIFGPDGFKADWRDHMFVHEYGHYLQSLRFGPLYTSIVGTSSLASAAFGESGTHITHWYEVHASHLGGDYFDKHYGSGAPGYEKGSEDYFDIEYFKLGSYGYMDNYGKLPYHNPRNVKDENGRIIFDRNAEAYPMSNPDVIPSDFYMPLIGFIIF